MSSFLCYNFKCVCVCLMLVRTSLSVNSQVTLVVDQDGSRLWAKSESEQATLLDGRELFSFGSGTWYDGTDASEMMESSEGKWISCNISLSSSIILEKKKCLTHLAESLPCLEKPTPLGELLSLLEDAGEAGYLACCFCPMYFVINPNLRSDSLADCMHTR